MKMSFIAVVVVVTNNSDTLSGKIIGPVARQLSAALTMMQCSAYGLRSRKVIDCCLGHRPSGSNPEDDNNNNNVDEDSTNPTTPAHIPIQPCATRSVLLVLQCVINDDDDGAPPCPPCPPPPCRCHSAHKGPTATSIVPWAIHFPSSDPHPSVSKCRHTTPTRIPCWVASPGEDPFAAAAAVMTLLLPPQVVLATLITRHL